MTDLILGVDGGGSKTQLCLVDRSGALVHQSRVGGSNPADNPKWRDALEALLTPIAPLHARIAQAVVAIGGYHENPILDQRVELVVSSLLNGIPTAVDNDVYVANDAAFLGAPGVLLIAGTGSMAVTRAHDGTLTRNGGWGDVFGDEGSAYWIGREALSLATQALDGRGPATKLAEVLPFPLIGTPGERLVAIFDWIGALQHPRSELAALAAIAIAAAEAGDAVAQSLIDAAVQHLAAHVRAGWHAGQFGAGGAWSMLGGLGRSALIRTRLERQLGPLQSPALPPVGGALWRAARLADWPIDPHWLDQLRAALTE